MSSSNSKMAPDHRPQLFTRLRRAIQNVRFLLSFNASRWIRSSFLGTSASLDRRRLSFKSQPSGLLDCCTDEDYHEAGSSFVLSRSTSLTADTSRSASPASDITRTMSGASSPSSPDDIDRRAEEFIANFYRHIQMERQVSLELRYCKGKDLERTRSE